MVEFVPDRVRLPVLNPADVRTLDALAEKSHAAVVDVDGDAAFVHRLYAMGLCVGRRLEVLRSREPFVVRVMGTRLGLSAEMARRIHVSLCDSSARHCVAEPAGVVTPAATV